MTNMTPGRRRAFAGSNTGPTDRFLRILIGLVLVAFALALRAGRGARFGE